MFIIPHLFFKHNSMAPFPIWYLFKRLLKNTKQQQNYVYPLYLYPFNIFYANAIVPKHAAPVTAYSPDDSWFILYSGRMYWFNCLENRQWACVVFYRTVSQHFMISSVNWHGSYITQIEPLATGAASSGSKLVKHPMYKGIHVTK